VNDDDDHDHDCHHVHHDDANLTPAGLDEEAKDEESVPLVAPADHFLFLHHKLYRFGGEIPGSALAEAVLDFCRDYSDFCYFPLMNAARAYLRVKRVGPPQSSSYLINVVHRRPV
jgi:hypothetical protein